MRFSYFIYKNWAWNYLYMKLWVWDEILRFDEIVLSFIRVADMISILELFLTGSEELFS